MILPLRERSKENRRFSLREGFEGNRRFPCLIELVFRDASDIFFQMIKQPISKSPIFSFITDG